MPTTLSSPVPRESLVPRGDDGQWNALLTTRTGFSVFVRPARPADEAALGDFFARLSPEDLRFRFLTATRSVSHDVLEMMTRVDHHRTENFLAFGLNAGPIIASAMLAADEEMKRAEVAISICTDYHRLGIGWTLLSYVVRFAAAMGIETLESVQSQDDHEAIALEREMGFDARPYPGDPTLVLLEARLRRRLLR